MSQAEWDEGKADELDQARNALKVAAALASSRGEKGAKKLINQKVEELDDWLRHRHLGQVRCT